VGGFLLLKPRKGWECPLFSPKMGLRLFADGLFIFVSKGNIAQKKTVFCRRHEQFFINVPQFRGNLIVHSAANQLRLSLYQLPAEPQTHPDVSRDCARDEFTIVCARQ
jgi:hypothetical protein